MDILIQFLELFVLMDGRQVRSDVYYAGKKIMDEIIEERIRHYKQITIIQEECNRLLLKNRELEEENKKLKDRLNAFIHNENASLNSKQKF